MNEVKYEQDFYTWTQEQARLLREGRFAELDAANVAAPPVVSGEFCPDIA